MTADGRPVLSVDVSDVNAAMQELKLGIEHLLGATIYMRDEHGEVVASAGISEAKGPIEQVVGLSMQIVQALGGEVLAEHGKAESVSAGLGICGARLERPFEMDRLCGFPPHTGPHSWE